MEYTNTYCNPIVLPAYPSLETRSEEKRFDIPQTPDTIMEYQLYAELGKPLLRFRRTELKTACENDVRATADPSPYFFEGKWWLYPTSGMIYSSDDLVHWDIHYEPTWEEISYPMAPTVEKVGDVYVACANFLPVYTSPTPVGPWTCIGPWTLPDGRALKAGDVMIFSDDDGRAYLYFGLGMLIAGAELDTEHPNRLLSTPKVLVEFDTANTWEHFGARNEDAGNGMLEGSWMLKHNGEYYLVYSCAGTQFSTYAMGACRSSSPLGPFVRQKHNPVSRSVQGLVTGGGHGGFVKGPGDTFWIFYTIPVCIDHDMERRIGMDPAGFDENGDLFALTGCDVPQWNPGVLERPELGNEAGLMPVSVGKPIEVSSYAPGQRARYAVDDSLKTYWQPAEGDKAPTLTVDLRAPYRWSAVRLCWKDIGLYFDGGVLPGPYRYVVEGYDGNEWSTLVDASDNDIDLTVDYRTFPERECSAVRLKILGAPEGITPGLLQFTVFGSNEPLQKQ